MKVCINVFALNITATMRDEEPRYGSLSGLYCRTQISV